MPSEADRSRVWGSGCSWPVRRPSTLTRRRATKPAIIASTTISTNQPPLIALFLRLDTWSLAGRSAKVQRQSHRNRVDPHSFKRSEEHTSELQSLMRISYAVFCLKKKNLQPHSKNAVSRTLANHH